jgi:hypothetical protein
VAQIGHDYKAIVISKTRFWGIIRTPLRSESPRKLQQFADIIEFNGNYADSAEISEGDDSASKVALYRKHHCIQ